jgi:hypothetical protein
MTGTIYTAAPHDNPLNEIIRDNQLLYRKLESYESDIARKLFLHELQTYIRRYAISDNDGQLRFTITKPAINIYHVDDLLSRIEAEMSLYEERIRFSGLLPSSSPNRPVENEPEEPQNDRHNLYGSPRDVARFILSAERAGLLPRSLPTTDITNFFGVRASSYESEYRRLRGDNYTPPRLKTVQLFLEQWLTNMSNDDLESIILTLRKLQA